jgi:aspartate aminotransferase
MTIPPLAKIFGAAELPATMAMAARARALKAAGKPVISLSLGEPDFAPAPHILDAADRAARGGETKYPPLGGIPSLREAIIRKFARDQGLIATAETIAIGNGARQVIFSALMATLDPGSNIVVPAPYWNAYPLIAKAAGAATITVPCCAAKNYLPDPAAIAAAITPATRWVVLNFPSNPTGAVCPPEHMAAIGAALRPHPHIWIMADDIYEHLIHDGSAPVCLAKLCPDLADRTLTISGVSKTYAMTGFRVGFATGPRRLIEAMTRAQGLATGGVCGIAQAAAAAALDGPQENVALMRQTYAARAKLTVAALSRVKNLICPAPQGAFYAFCDVSAWLGLRSAGGHVLADDSDITMALLEENNVALVAGSAFGAPGHMRLSTAASDADLIEACARITAFAAGLG